MNNEIIRNDEVATKEKSPEQDKFNVKEKLFESRQLLICGEINQKLAAKITEELLALEAEDNKSDITLFINSQGGHVEAGDTIHDMIRFIKPTVKVIGTGWVASAGTHIYLAADKENRYCLPNTRFLIHQPLGGTRGSASDIHIQAEQIVKMRERLAKVISKSTGQEIKKVRLDIDRDYWMNTDEATEYGIVHKVIKKRQF
ncbi:ATP-dependent Clp protease proteolytic subunit [Thiotrichales bacterium 19S3-7]|nr:ATP-dependent Clp protease proteolytic subunit [Thiotrichales bacterium 19S3-7]MCF6801350.1 ATP-dependent Clp protease proteolytic subunit [Thiotrichales bacterium 19S3-11]